ncbi:GNAT family N-acetyltransferase [Kitasatospora sp. NPDC050467]|uniref:GNAT family N-acetyltransferase n=1 Tax=Kitasatospora sp. NPDC050467 TaxID=3364053 RepID=UPI00379A6D60
MRIRVATREELPLLGELERAAGAPYATIGIPEIAEDDPPTVDELAHYLDEGTVLVALAEDGGAPVGYLLAEPVDGALHIEQVSVHPGHARRGIGRALIEHLAAGTDAPALTLTTFADVPWNAPYYARFGFRPLDGAEVTPGLREIRRREAEHGLDRWPRLCMRRELGEGVPPVLPGARRMVGRTGPS